MKDSEMSSVAPESGFPWAAVESLPSACLVDVHAHLCYEDFCEHMEAWDARFQEVKVGAVVVNGLEPRSNGITLQLAQRFPRLQAACGIYPVHAVNHCLPSQHPYRIADFDLEDALHDIAIAAQRGDVVAIGECGLDGYALEGAYHDEQVQVFSRLVEMAQRYHLPVIVHSRKCERQTMEVLAKLGAQKVIFHCYMGKVALALQGAQERGWYFSIPAISSRHQGFTKMLQKLPSERILTETDSPYLAYEREQKNDPRQVARVIAHLALLRGWSYQQAAERVWENYLRIFTPS